MKSLLRLLVGGTLMGWFGQGANAATGIDNLEIEVGNEWSEVPVSDPEQRNFLSADGNVGITISSMDIEIRPDQTEQVAVKLAQLRLQGHKQYHSEAGGRTEITEPVFQEHSWGHHLEYDGRNDDGRVFSFFGFVTTRQIVSIFAEGPGTTDDAGDYMHAAVQDFIDSVKFEMPAIR